MLDSLREQHLVRMAIPTGVSAHRDTYLHACTCMLILTGHANIHKSAFLWMCTHVYKYRQGHTHVHTCAYIYLQVHVALSLAHMHIFMRVLTCIYVDMYHVSYVCSCPHVNTTFSFLTDTKHTYLKANTLHFIYRLLDISSGKN